MTALREPIFSALLALVTNAYAWNAPPSRRLSLWDKVPPESMPTLFQFEGGEDEYVWEEDLLLRRTLSVRLFAYVNSKDTSVTGATAINDILDALDAAFQPATIADRLANRLTLGGLVSSCRITGCVLKDPGDLDGIGLIVAPVMIVLP
jgi:hypothetical protein